MKKIFLIGDASIDWLVYYQPNQTPKGSNKQTKNLENNPRAIVHKLPGGVLLLKEFLKQVKEEGDQLITYPDKDIDEITKSVHTHTFAIVKNYDDKHTEIMRVDQFLGYTGKEINEKEKLSVEGNPSEADLIIIDDAGNGIRDDKNGWINYLNKNEKQFRIIHKINWPLKDNKLVKKLTEKFSDKMIAIVNADDLREHGLEISRQLSWDKTIEDFLTTFPYNQGLEDLRKCYTIIIRFNLEATVVMFRNADVEKEKDEARKFEYYFFYDPSKYEGQTMDDTQGNMQGLTPAFIAATAQRLSYPSYEPGKGISPEDVNRFFFLSAIIPGMKTAINFLNRGYNSTEDASEINYDLQKLFPGEGANKKAGDDKNIQKKKDPIQLADISGYMEGSKPRSILKHVTFNSKDLISSVAFDYVNSGDSRFLDKIPVFQTGQFKTYDNEEIESYRSFNKLINEYRYGSARKPLSVAVFGPPGSGKSFGVKQIAGSENFKDKIITIETNLSQLQSYDDLITIFHAVRDINLSGKIPLIFFDEFDASFGDKPLGWIKYFLAPMQDGEFKDGEKMHPLGRAIFVFAGGTCFTFEEFAGQIDKKDKPEGDAGATNNGDNNPTQTTHGKTPEEIVKELKALKVPDFISRLKGFINIKGIDRQMDKDDIFYPLRRAIVLRSMVERDYKNLVDSNKKMNIDCEVLAAFLQIDSFKYGARSQEAIIKMSDLTNERSFKKSNLASNALLDIHVETKKFKGLMKEDKIFPPELFEPIAEQIHANWYEKEEKNKEHSPKATLKLWKDLDEGTKDSNRGQAIDMLRKLNALGYTVTRNAELKEVIEGFSDEEMEKMARMEHDRWNQEKITQGWTYGKIRNDALKVHDCLLPWDKLPDDIKKYDYEAVEAIPGILESVGFGVVKGD